MKVLSYENYEYIGVWGRFHAFRCVRQHYYPEIILEITARMVLQDGRSVFFDPVYKEEQLDLSCVRNQLNEEWDVFLQRKGAYSQK